MKISFCDTPYKNNFAPWKIKIDFDPCCTVDILKEDVSHLPPHLTEAHIPLRTAFALGTQRKKDGMNNMKSTRWGFALGVTQILCLALGVTRNANFSVFRYQHVGIPKVKLWLWGCKPTPGPNAKGFASQWNIGFRLSSSFNISVLH